MIHHIISLVENIRDSSDKFNSTDETIIRQGLFANHMINSMKADKSVTSEENIDKLNGRQGSGNGNSGRDEFEPDIGITLLNSDDNQVKLLFLKHYNIAPSFDLGYLGGKNDGLSSAGENNNNKLVDRLLLNKIVMVNDKLSSGYKPSVGNIADKTVPKREISQSEVMNETERVLQVRSNVKQNNAINAPAKKLVEVTDRLFSNNVEKGPQVLFNNHSSIKKQNDPTIISKLISMDSLRISPLNINDNRSDDHNIQIKITFPFDESIVKKSNEEDNSLKNGLTINRDIHSLSTKNENNRISIDNSELSSIIMSKKPGIIPKFTVVNNYYFDENAEVPKVSRAIGQSVPYHPDAIKEMFLRYNSTTDNGLIDKDEVNVAKSMVNNKANDMSQDQRRDKDESPRMFMPARSVIRNHIDINKNNYYNKMEESRDLVQGTPEIKAEEIKYFKVNDAAGIYANIAHTNHPGIKSAKLSGDKIPEFTRNAIDNIARIVSLRLQDNFSEIRIRLNPAYLGDIMMKLSMEKGRMNAQLDISNGAVKSAIEAQLPQLREALLLRGIEIQRFDIFSGGQFNQSEGKDGNSSKSSRYMEGDSNNEGAEETYIRHRNFEYNTLELTI